VQRCGSRRDQQRIVDIQNLQRGLPTAGDSRDIDRLVKDRLRSYPNWLASRNLSNEASDVSEPGGYFRITDNFTSNEREVGRRRPLVVEPHFDFDGRRLRRVKSCLGALS
jgi:hypothetical protein